MSATAFDRVQSILSAVASIQRVVGSTPDLPLNTDDEVLDILRDLDTMAHDALAMIEDIEAAL